MLYSETPEIHMHTLKVGVLDVSGVEGGFTFELFRQVAYPRLLALAPLRYQLVDIPLKLHHPMWMENDDIDLDYHVRHVQVPAPGGRRELDQLIGHIASTTAGSWAPAVGDVCRPRPDRQPDRDHPQGPSRPRRWGGVGQSDGQGDAATPPDRGYVGFRRFGPQLGEPAEGGRT